MNIAHDNILALEQQRTCLLMNSNRRRLTFQVLAVTHPDYPVLFVARGVLEQIALEWPALDHHRSPWSLDSFVDVCCDSSILNLNNWHLES